MNNSENMLMDEGLRGNEKIEQAIAVLQQKASEELLAHTLTVIRRRLREGGQLIVAVEPPAGDAGVRAQVIRTENGRQSWVAFTSFAEEVRGSGSIMSTFLAEIRALFEAALLTEGIDGIILNPWNRTLMLDKTLIRIILGELAAESGKEK